MATTKKTEAVTTYNIYKKLQLARQDFFNEGVKKSGINTHAEFKYFELEDIVPVASKIFEKYNCLFLVTFPEDKAVGRFINLDNVEEELIVECKTTQIADPGKFRMNEIQALGANITYMRRYLYFLLLDIIQDDDIDNQDNSKITSTKPVTPEKREEIKNNLTNSKEQADKIQIKALKEALKKLKELDPGQEEFVQGVALKTKGLTNISKDVCEALINKVSDAIKVLEGGEV